MRRYVLKSTTDGSYYSHADCTDDIVFDENLGEAFLFRTSRDAEDAREVGEEVVPVEVKVVLVCDKLGS